MKKIKIYSPKGISNKERYLNDELAKLADKEIKLIEKCENGDIEITVKNQDGKTKYFVKIIKTEEKSFNISEYVKERWYVDILKSSIMMEHIEYKGFCVLFFKK